MKRQRHHRLPVGYKMTDALIARSEKPPVFLKNHKDQSEKHSEDRPLLQLGPRKSRKPVTLAKHA
jgi:hypothetical protein